MKAPGTMIEVSIPQRLFEDEIRLLDEVSSLPPEYPGCMLPFQAADRWGDDARPIGDYMLKSNANS